MDQRQTIARRAADGIAAADPSLSPSLVGFDGFVDEIIGVVDRRLGMAVDDFAPIRTIEAFSERIASAAGKSANIELVTREVRFGGNGPLLASALARLGSPTTYIGAVGRADDPTQLDPLYRPLADRCRKVIPVCQPGHTDALEFDDGKIMLGRTQPVQAVTWDRITRFVGLDTLADIVRNASLVAVVNWTLLGGVEGIWKGLIELVSSLPTRPRRFFIDLSDPAKRTDADLGRALGVLGDLNRAGPVTLGLNYAEAQRVARVAGVDAFTSEHDLVAGTTIERDTATLRDVLGLDCVVVHPRHGAAAARAAREVAWFDGPLVRSPRLSTGAGDHFGGGFAFAQVLGLTLEECLAVGCASSGAYVRDADSPMRDRLVDFLRDLPEPEWA